MTELDDLPGPGSNLETQAGETGSALARQDMLTARAQAYAEGARARSTWKSYERQWARFERWCTDAGETALPADPLTVVRFLADLAPVWRAATPADLHDVIVAPPTGSTDLVAAESAAPTASGRADTQVGLALHDQFAAGGRLSLTVGW